MTTQQCPGQFRDVGYDRIGWRDHIEFLNRYTDSLMPQRHVPPLPGDEPVPFADVNAEPETVDPAVTSARVRPGQRNTRKSWDRPGDRARTVEHRAKRRASGKLADDRAVSDEPAGDLVGQRSGIARRSLAKPVSHRAEQSPRVRTHAQAQNRTIQAVACQDRVDTGVCLIEAGEQVSALCQERGGVEGVGAALNLAVLHVERRYPRRVPIGRHPPRIRTRPADGTGHKWPKSGLHRYPVIAGHSEQVLGQALAAGWVTCSSTPNCG